MKILKTEEDEMLVFKTLMLNRQTTSTITCILHIIRRHQKEGYKHYIATEFSDIIHQIKEISVILGIDYYGLEKLGDERSKEKEAEFKKRYPKEKWI